MAILPLDTPEPFAATLGVMHYPGLDEPERARANAFASHWLAGPLSQSIQRGYQPADQTLRYIALGGGHELPDVEQRFDGGVLTGELFKVLYILADTEPALASWSNASEIVTIVTGRSRSSLYKLRSRFGAVAHLWAAWTIRSGRFCQQPDVGYEGHDDFQAFLTESEILRDFGQKWHAARDKSEPPLPPDVWRVPDEWKPPQRRRDWPKTGGIPRMSLPPELISGLRPAGRPRYQS